MRNKILIALGILALVGVSIKAQNVLAAVVEVARVTLVNQSSGYSATLYTPTKDGDYLILVYSDWDDYCATDTLYNETVSWTDTRQSRFLTTNVAPGTCGSGAELNQVTYIHAIANTPINFGLGYNGGTTNRPFDLTVVVVKQ